MTKHRTLRINDDLWEWAQEYASEKKTTVSDLLRDYLIRLRKDEDSIEDSRAKMEYYRSDQAIRDWRKVHGLPEED